MMRTFSGLKLLCAWPEEIDKGPKKNRDLAGAMGTRFHKAKQLWVMTGDTSHFDSLANPERAWLYELARTWVPPEDIEMEVCLGLCVAHDGSPRYVSVTEEPPDSHNYVLSGSCREEKEPPVLLTAGRADMIFKAAGEVDCVLHVDDIKTGKYYLGPPDRVTQVLAQGIAATLRAGADGFIPGIYYARVNQWDRAKKPILYGSPGWTEAWEQVKAAALLPSKPIPGGHCLDCWSKKLCKSNPEVAA